MSLTNKSHEVEEHPKWLGPLEPFVSFALPAPWHQPVRLRGLGNLWPHSDYRCFFVKLFESKFVNLSKIRSIKYMMYISIFTPSFEGTAFCQLELARDFALLDLSRWKCTFTKGTMEFLDLLKFQPLNALIIIIITLLHPYLWLFEYLMVGSFFSVWVVTTITTVPSWCIHRCISLSPP